MVQTITLFFFQQNLFSVLQCNTNLSTLIVILAIFGLYRLFLWQLNQTTNMNRDYLKIPARPLLLQILNKRLTTEEAGALVLLYLWMTQSKDGTLEDDEKDLARLLNCSEQKFRKIRKEIEVFFKISRGKWSSVELTEIIKKYDKTVANRQKAANTRWQRLDMQMHYQPEPEPKP